MKSDDDLIAGEIVRQARPAAMGSRLNAGSSGAHPAGLGGSSTMVDEDGHVKREWLMGDPWTSRYYFKDYKTNA